MTIICPSCQGLIYQDCDVLGEYTFIRCWKCSKVKAEKVLFPPKSHIVPERNAPELKNKENAI